MANCMSTITIRDNLSFPSERKFERHCSAAVVAGGRGAMFLISVCYSHLAAAKWLFLAEVRGGQ